MNTKELWILNFEEFLWQHHTCDWDAGNSKPDYPYQLACAYFDWGDDCSNVHKVSKDRQLQLAKEYRKHVINTGEI